jgi:amino acid transporter
VWQLAGQSVLMRIAAALIAINVLISGVAETFLPMRLGQAPGTLHAALMATAMLAFVGAIALGGAGSSGWLRYLSYGIILAFIILTAVGLIFPARNADGRPVATIGVQERTMVLAYLLWVIALAVQRLTAR